MAAAREIRYRTIADDVRRQIAAGELGPGAVLASEADLAGLYDVSRITVRKALDVLRDEGRLESRQGFGWFVAGDTVRQALGVLGTIEGQLAAAGRRTRRHVHAFGFVTPPAEVAADLGLVPGDDVLEVVRVNTADDRPFALVTVWCPAELGAALSRDQVESATFYELLPVHFGGATQSIGAVVADDRDVALLDVPAGSPLLVCSRVSRDTAGLAVLASEHRFPAHLTEFTVELAALEGDADPVGLRLV